MNVDPEYKKCTAGSSRGTWYINIMSVLSLLMLKQSGGARYIMRNLNLQRSLTYIGYTVHYALHGGGAGEKGRGSGRTWELYILFLEYISIDEQRSDGTFVFHLGIILLCPVNSHFFHLGINYSVVWSKFITIFWCLVSPGSPLVSFLWFQGPASPRRVQWSSWLKRTWRRYLYTIKKM